MNSTYADILTRCTIGVKFGMEELTKGRILTPNFDPVGGVEPPELQILTILGI